MVQRLSRLFSRAVELQVFYGIRVGSSYLVVSDIQYIDDTSIPADASLDDL